MGDCPLKGLRAGLVGLLCCISSVAVAQEASLFKILKLEGNQVRWTLPRDGSAPVITYRIATEQTDFPKARNCRKLTNFDGLSATSELTTAQIEAELAAAFSMWEEVANISFVEVPAGTRADILIGAQVDPEGWAFADVFYELASAQPVKPISRALVCLNPTRKWKIGFDGNLRSYDLRYTFAHEIGHAIGLDHPAVGAQIMGYRYEEQFRTLQPGDIGGALALYGARQPEVLHTQVLNKDAHAPISTLRRFTKRWGTRGLAPRSP
jgi:hypothetical protein